MSRLASLTPPQGWSAALVDHGRVLADQLRRSHVADADLHAALRRAGLGGVEQAACVIMEASGHLSVIRAGVPIDPALLAGVVGAERVLGPTD